MIRWCSGLFALLLLMIGSGTVAHGGFIGTMSFNYTLDLSFLVSSGPGITDHPSGIDFLSPRLLYSSTAEGVASHTGPIGGEGLESGIHNFVYEIPNFPLPSPSSKPFGGFFAYYSYTDFNNALVEGAFVGLASNVTPTEPFDELFKSTGVNEAQFLATLKTSGPEGVLATMSMFSAMTGSGLMPTWSYDVGQGSWSIPMNVYAFSSPQLSGTISGGLVATPAQTVPEPSSLVIAVTFFFSWGLVSHRRRRPLTNALSEGFNRKIQQIKSNVRGFSSIAPGLPQSHQVRLP